MRLFAGSQKRLAELVPILLMATMCFSQTRGNPEDRTALEQNNLETYIAGILAKAEVPASLEYSGECGSHVYQFPPANMAGRDQGKATLQTLQEVFSADPKMQVRQQADGTIRMVEKDVPTELLNVKIQHVAFKATDVHGTEAALWDILDAPEVRSFMRDHQIYMVPTYAGPFSLGKPPLPESLEEVTFSQALDRVLKTFPGYWVYKSCSDEHGGVSIRFIPSFAQQHGPK